MCKCLSIARSTYYDNINSNKNKTSNNSRYDKQIKSIFLASKKSYGKRSIKNDLEDLNIFVSIKFVRQATKRLKLESTYCKNGYKSTSNGKNDDHIDNVLNRNFKNRKLNEVLVSDLTYIKTGKNYSYVCFITDLYNREIVGYSVGPRKTSELVFEAFKTLKFNLKNVALFHTDRGLEFKNSKIESLLENNNIKRSLSRSGNPYDNAIAESMFKTFKTTWVQGSIYTDIIELSADVKRYIQWYNNMRCHSTLNYKSPVGYRLCNVAA